jgi:hypothetical protein
MTGLPPASSRPTLAGDLPAAPQHRELAALRRAATRTAAATAHGTLLRRHTDRATARLATAAIGLAALVIQAGCAEFFDEIVDDGQGVTVLSTHHATSPDGLPPPRAEDRAPRTFTSDLGWTITMSSAYVNQVGANLIDCEGRDNFLDSYFGHLAEWMNGMDLVTTTLAGDVVESGRYCVLVVEYGPYDPNAAASAGSRHPRPTEPAMVGASVWIEGTAVREGLDPVPFTLSTAERAFVRFDLRGLEGDPASGIEISDSAAFPTELTVSKAYDRFFDGVDFANLDVPALEATLASTIGVHTFVSLGGVVDFRNAKPSTLP